MGFVFQFIVCIVVVEALTELIVKSSILELPVRFISQQNAFIGKMLSCGYCTSVWMALLPSLYLAFVQETVNPLFAFLVFWLSLHRLSNYLHNINDKYFNKFYSQVQEVGVKDG